MNRLRVSDEGGALRNRFQLARRLGILVLVFIASCAPHPTLGRPAFIGASATAGYGASVTTDDGDELPVDLAVMFEASVTARHDTPRRFSDGAFFARPSEAAREQLAALQGGDASIIFAIDWLFWSVYAPTSAPPGTSDAATERAARLGESLALLETFDGQGVVIVLGDIPPIPLSDTGSSFIPRERHLSDSERQALNDAIEAWAASRSNVIVLPVSRLAAQVDAERAAARDGANATANPLVQPDGLHPSDRGLLALMLEALAALEAQGLIEPNDWADHTELDESRVVEVARRALQSPSTGWLDTAAASLAMDRLQDALDANDCDAARRAADQLYPLVLRFDRDPTGTGLATLFLDAVTDRMLQLCPDTRPIVARTVERLGFETRVPEPNALRLELWARLAVLLDRSPEVIARLAALNMRFEAPWETYSDTYDFVLAHFHRRASWQSPLDPQRALRIEAVRVLGGPERAMAYALNQVDEVQADPTTTGQARLADQLSPPAFPTTAEWARETRHLGRRLTRTLDIQRDFMAADDLVQARAVRGALVDRFGEEAIARAIAMSALSDSDRFLPGWSVDVNGPVDAEAMQRWLFTGDGSVPGESGSASRRAVFPAMEASIIAAVKCGLAIGFLGDPVEPEGIITTLDDTIVVGRAHESSGDVRGGAPVTSDRTRHVVRCRLKTWMDHTIPGSADRAALAQSVWTVAGHAGIDRIWPFPFSISGPVRRLVVSVPRAGADPVVLELHDVDAALVGVMAPFMVGTIVRPGEVMRLHAIWTDAHGERVTGEVVEVEMTAPAALRLPAPALTVPPEGATLTSAARPLCTTAR